MLVYVRHGSRRRRWFIERLHSLYFFFTHYLSTTTMLMTSVIAVSLGRSRWDISIDLLFWQCRLSLTRENPMWNVITGGCVIEGCYGSHDGRHGCVLSFSSEGSHAQVWYVVVVAYFSSRRLMLSCNLGVIREPEIIRWGAVGCFHFFRALVMNEGYNLLNQQNETRLQLYVPYAFLEC